jgi:hypothetical protein
MHWHCVAVRWNARFPERIRSLRPSDRCKASLREGRHVVEAVVVVAVVVVVVVSGGDGDGGGGQWL